MKKRYLLAIAVISACLAACEYIAVQSAPKKQAATSRSEAALKADTLFWETLHNGEYEKIPNALEVLTAAYLDNPTDSITAAHVGWLHIWRISERARLDSVPPTLTDDAVMARKYFVESPGSGGADAASCLSAPPVGLLSRTGDSTSSHLRVETLPTKLPLGGFYPAGGI
jgi:hypothetical protein